METLSASDWKLVAPENPKDTNTFRGTETTAPTRAHAQL